MTKTKADIYQQVTDSIIAVLEEGTKPWVKPWQAGIVRRPLRHNGVAYTGINILMLWLKAEKGGYKAPYWMTYAQAAELGGQVRKGEKGAMVVYANTLSVTEENADGETEETHIPYMKSYNVFNVEQIDGLPERYYALQENITEPKERLKYADEFFQKTGAVIRQGGNRAYFTPSGDYIQMPDFDAFNSPEGYAGTLAHELTHWTGHNTRLDRLTASKFGSEDYAKEELVAELGAAFLCADLGIIPMLENHASYLQSWLKVLKKDKRAIFRASSQAQKAVEHLHSYQ